MSNWTNQECKICGASSHHVFTSTVLLKYDCNYFQCERCFFIQTETPYWLSEAYSSAITSSDIGLVQRNVSLSQIVFMVISLFFKKRGRFLDFAGGYGMLVRLLRDYGCNFYRKDIYCENLFAKQFDFENLAPNDRKFNLVTAFEVFEHLETPHETMKELLTYSDHILLSTELLPCKKKVSNDWWYFSPETGQHISFYHKESLRRLAVVHKLNFYTNNKNIHLFTKSKIWGALFCLITRVELLNLFIHFFKKSNKLQKLDYKYVKSIIHK